MFKRIAVFAMVAMLFLAVQAGRANADLVANGNFALGTSGLLASSWNVTGWTINGDPNAWATVNNDGLTSFAPPGPSATYALFSTEGTPVSISQTLTAAAGQTYTVSFYAVNGSPSYFGNNELEALWNGVQAINLPGASMSSAWTQYSFLITGGTGNNTNTLTFSFLQDDSEIDITNISTTPVPLPAALLLFGPGLAGTALLRKRFKS